MCGSRGPTDELSHRALPLSLSLSLSPARFLYVRVRCTPSTDNNEAETKARYNADVELD